MTTFHEEVNSINMSVSQIKGMLKFHRKAEKAYRSVGNNENADQAKHKVEVFEHALRRTSFHNHDEIEGFILSVANA